MGAMSDAPSPSPSTALDALFGVHTHQIGDAVLRVRRVMTVEQQREITAVEMASREVTKSIIAMGKRDTSTAELEAEMLKEVDDIEEGLRVKCISAINMMALGGIPGLDELSLTTLTWLFNELRGVVEHKTEAAVAATGFPTSGA